jgi:hypothetical protein
MCLSIRNESDIDNAITVLLENNADSLFLRADSINTSGRCAMVVSLSIMITSMEEQDFPHQVQEAAHLCV